MSIETLLQENTAAVKALTLAITAMGSSVGTVAGTNTPVILSNDKTEAKTPVETKAEPKPEVKKAATKPKAEPAKTEEETNTGELTYADVSPKLLELAKADRPKVVELLAKFGVAKGSDLKPTQFAAVLEAVEAALNPAASEEDSLV